MTEHTEKTTVTSFFTNSETVWVSENFKNIILDRYELRDAADRRSEGIQSSDLQDLGTETKPQQLVFSDPDVFLENLMGLIKDQLHGEEGKLLNDSSANYFFLKTKDGNHYSVLVRWEQAQRLWRCGAYLQEELRFPNIRIFYPT